MAVFLTSPRVTNYLVSNFFFDNRGCLGQALKLTRTSTNPIGLELNDRVKPSMTLRRLELAVTLENSNQGCC